ncbi:MAG TPA: hypothetical protein VES68_01165 [Candidatus Sulfotelmatobacter sp.]|nr:hypothetical protein [Candidatus Sulfotelmatobacter sp.]
MDIDQRIKNILIDLEVAHQKTEKFLGHRLNATEPVKPVDLFEMAIAYEDQERILIDLEIAFSERFPQHYTQQQIEGLNKEKERLTHRIRAWQNGQFPSEYRG